MKIFGFEILSSKKEQGVTSVVTPSNDDGSTVVTTSAAAYYSQVLDFETTLKNENELIRKYREISKYPECDSAIEDIVNEAIVTEEGEQSVNIVLDDVSELSDGIKKKISKEFDNVLRVLQFEEKGHDIFRQWYIDGRLYYQILIDEEKVSDGIHELRNIDPRKIRKIKKVDKKKEKGIEIVDKIEEYYIYNEKGITQQTTQGVKLAADSIVYCSSGFMDGNTGMTLSYLHKAVKPVNQLKMIEDAVVIYRISRAPERRIFYIDVGNLPKVKAEQYVNDIMNKYRNKIVYDANTGELKDDRRHLSMLEDFWMPRREGGKGTEITTLQGGQNLSNIEDINYFQQKLYQSLNVPIGRLLPQQNFSLGRSSEITRDELKFGRFVQRLRKKFSNIFNDILRVQLVAKNIITPEEWDDICTFVRYDFNKDNYFTELKESEITQQRLANLQVLEPFIGRFFSKEWVQKNVLRLTEDGIKEMQDQIDKEMETNPEPVTPENQPSQDSEEEKK